MSATLPPAVLPADALFDPVRMKRGPLEVLWGVEEWVERDVDDDRADQEYVAGRRPLRARLLGRRLFRFDARIAPPDGADLQEWGLLVAERLGMPVPEFRSTDKGMWLIGGVYARHAGRALGGSAKVFQKLDGIYIGTAQLRVELAPEASR